MQEVDRDRGVGGVGGRDEGRIDACWSELAVIGRPTEPLWRSQAGLSIRQNPLPSLPA